MYSAEFESIKDQCTLCKKCPFYKERLNIVFGCGNEKADILFVGDMPSGKDDLNGLPFTGKEGKIFDRFLSLCDMNKEKDIFITNILKCRPADGEIPDSGHFDACMEHLRIQVRSIKPKIIVCLGKTVAKKMISPAFDFDKDHGKFIKKGKFFFLATYHPTEITESENKRITFLSDFQALREGAKKGGII